MPRDVNLQLETGRTIVADGDSAVIETEGGGYAVVRMKFGTLGAAADTLVTTVQCSVDGGANYFDIGSFPSLLGTDDNLEIARPVYIPWPDTPGTLVKVKLNHNVSANGTESFAITWAFLEPLLTLAVPALDEKLGIGLAALT